MQNGLFAQSATDSQLFTVVVGDAISISAPSDQTINHNLADSDQPFAVQAWNVFTTNATGANVVLTMGRFINTADASFFRDGELDLSVISTDSTSSWGGGVGAVGSDTTIASGTASVSVGSTGPGTGQLGILVTFLETDASTLASGHYTTTVTGTITNNP